MTTLQVCKKEMRVRGCHQKMFGGTVELECKTCIGGCVVRGAFVAMKECGCEKNQVFPVHVPLEALD